MKRKIKLLLLGLISVVTLLSVTQLTFSYLATEELFGGAKPAEVELTRKEQSETTESIKPGGTLQDEPYIRNSGEVPCYLRIKIQIPTQNDEPIFRLGRLSDGNISELLFSDADIGILTLQDEYWQREGDYIYYKNKSTGNRLLQNSSTPVLYSAVSVIPDLKAETLGISGDENQDIIICAEALNSDMFQNEEEAWNSLEARAYS